MKNDGHLKPARVSIFLNYSRTKHGNKGDGHFGREISFMNTQDQWKQLLRNILSA